MRTTICDNLGVATTLHIDAAVTSPAALWLVMYTAEDPAIIMRLTVPDARTLHDRLSTFLDENAPHCAIGRSTVCDSLATGDCAACWDE